MMNYLIGLLRKAGKEPLEIRYLNKAEGEGVWCDGRLLAIDPQGLSFLRLDGERPIAECLPWGSVAAIRIDIEFDRDGIDNDEQQEDRHGPFLASS
jgi:hypothetical protein